MASVVASVVENVVGLVGMVWLLLVVVRVADELVSAAGLAVQLVVAPVVRRAALPEQGRADAPVAIVVPAVLAPTLGAVAPVAIASVVDPADVRKWAPVAVAEANETRRKRAVVALVAVNRAVAVVAPDAAVAPASLALRKSPSRLNLLGLSLRI